VTRVFVDLANVLFVSLRVERGRICDGPRGLVARLRAEGLKRRARGALGRLRLQRMIRWVDRLFPGGPNCYRRALVEISLDSGAAAEPLHIGIRAAGTLTSGHAWLESSSDRGTDYSAEFSI
jgi:hypothetical protein